MGCARWTKSHAPSGLPDATVWEIAFALLCFGALRPAGLGAEATNACDLECAICRSRANGVFGSAGLCAGTRRRLLPSLGLGSTGRRATEVRRAPPAFCVGKSLARGFLGPELAHELNTKRRNTICDRSGTRGLLTQAFRPHHPLRAGPYHLNLDARIRIAQASSESNAEPSPEAPKG